MSDIEFEPGAVFSEEENRKVERAIRAEMQVDEQVLEQSKHAPVIAPGRVTGEFPRLDREGQVTMLKKKPVVPVVPQQKKKEAKKPEEKEIPKGPKAGTKKPEVKKLTEKKPEGKKPEETKPEGKKLQEKKPEGKKPEEKKKETWV